MNAIFGLGMDEIMYVLVTLLCVALGSVAFVAIRNPIMFKMGVRNIPRRRAQTVLIVLGLMLSTIIISAAFATGDTVDRSVTGQVYDNLGSMDELVTLHRQTSNDFEDQLQATLLQASFPAAQAQPLINDLSTNPLIDFVIPSFNGVAASENVGKTEHLGSLLNLLGMDPGRAGALPDIVTADGKVVHVGDLAPGELFLDESAAYELNVAAGDAVLIHVNGTATTFKIRDIVQDKRLAGAAGISTVREGAVMPLAAMQDLFGVPGQLNQIIISNRGDARGGLRYSSTLQDQINASIANFRKSSPSTPALSVTTIKSTGVDIAEQASSIFTTFFLVLGLFSIGAGALLIFMIFVMLAAERKPEMGMARAVGTRRSDLVQTFLAEGMAYNLLAALVGTGLGVLVAFAMAKVMAHIFSTLQINISPHVTARSLVVSYCFGVVLTFLTVTFSSWRVSYLNIVRAIRDIPEPPTPRPLWRAHGFLTTLRRLVFKPGSLKQSGARLALFVIAVAIWGATLPTGTTLLQVLGGLIGGIVFLSAVFITFQTALLFIVASIPLLVGSTQTSSAFPLLFGLSLLPLGLALTVRSFGANERATYTIAGLILVYIWEFDFSVGLIKRVFGAKTGGPELFFLSGFMVTIAATFLVVYNSDIVLAVVTRLGGHLGKLLPSLKMAVAYPLASKVRTGMTMAMFCLVVFALTVISSMNHNFNRLFLSDRSLGGWDVQVDELPTNPIANLRDALTTAKSDALAKIRGVGVVSLTTRARGRACEATDTAPCSSATADNFHPYTIAGADSEFLTAQRIPLQARAHGYSDDAAVWQAIANDPSLAIVDANALKASGGGFGGGGFISGIDASVASFDPVSVTLADGATGKTQAVKVVGVIEMGASANYAAISVNQRAFDAVFGKPDFRRIYVQTIGGINYDDTARQIESALIVTGAQAESLRHQRDQQNATQSGFLLLMQGFMALGLVVGVAAVGVIAFRTVVERRQQIGMLRALGYTRGMIGITFMMESAYISFAGVLSGIVFALILARQLIIQMFANQGVHTFSVPWLEIGAIGGLAFGCALLMTLIPSRQAASIPIAEALRYE